MVHFPQLAGLGLSPTAKRFAIRSADEARAYLAHPVLGERLREAVAETLIAFVPEHDVEAIFGPLDAMKLRSSLTPFDAVAPGEVFETALQALFNGPDQRTLALLNGGA